jgi:histidyl-tRNA synthetase
MFTFEDQGGRSITLRPEATASIVRAYMEHGMHKLPQPVKLWWYGPLFRHERPQAGRFRQFTQLDAEVIGSDSPLVDAELILLLDELLRSLEVPELTLRLGSLGSLEARGAYRNELIAYLREHEEELARDVRDRIDENPLRAFDSKDESTQRVMAGAPTMLDRLEGEDAEHFAAVRRLLDQAGVPYELDGTLARGLDYYTRTVFEFHSGRLPPDVSVAGGGRYDRLIELLGGPPTPANGWAAGLERILLAIGAPEEESPHDVFVVAEDAQRERALALVTELRRAGLRADLDLAGRSMKGQMRQADRLGADRVVIIDADGSAQVRDMRSGEQRAIDPGRVVEELGAG